MRIYWAASVLVFLSGIGFGQGKAATTDGPKSVTVPLTIDHNRVIVESDMTLPDGTSQRVHTWVDNGDPDFWMSRHMATLLALNVSCDDKECSAPPPAAINIGGMTVSLGGLKTAHIPLKPVSAASVLAAGVPAEMNLPSSVLRHYDVLVDFPGRKFSIGEPGTLQFHGERAKAQINGENGLIQIPSQIEGKKYNLALDVGSCINFLAEDIFDKIAAANPEWPRMTGAVGSANMWGAAEEPQWKIVRVDRVQYGPLFLTHVPFVALPKATVDFFEKRAATPTAGLLSSEALLNYRVGLDYPHSAVYLDLGRTFNFPDFDVIGLVLKPEDDGHFTVLGVADFEGQPSLPSGPDGVQAGDHLVAVSGIPVRGISMGQVWALLGGTQGQTRKLSIERNGKQFVVEATVHRFLAQAADENKQKKK